MSSSTLKQRHPPQNTASSPQSPPKKQLQQPLSSQSSFLSIIATPSVKSALTFVAFDGLGFLISFTTGSHLHLDLIGTGSFIPAALIAQSGSASSLTLSSLAIILWALRLSSFLFYRALQVRHDARLTLMLETVYGMSSFWYVSVLWGVFCTLPHTLALPLSSMKKKPKVEELSLTSIVVKGGGFIVYVVGLVIEVLADHQKYQFKQSGPAGRFCDVGLWKLSQHPNYLGNILIFLGILLINLPELFDTSKKYLVNNTFYRVLLASLSPLFMVVLLCGQANGSITNTVELADLKYSSIEGWEEYRSTTNLVVFNLDEVVVYVLGLISSLR